MDLISLFDKASESPEFIPKLRQLILDLAVRGKLVPQNPKDEPASELLKKIKAEKDKLVKEGKIRPEKMLQPISQDEISFKIPKNWEWVRLQNILIKLTDGTHHSPPNFDKGDYKYVTAKNIKSDGVELRNITYVSKEIHKEIYSRCNPEKGDILYIKDGATTGIVTINNLDEPFSMLSSVALLKISNNIYNQFLVFFLRSPFFYNQMRALMKGAAITRVTLKTISPTSLPLPPLTEQKRIVAKIDELMSLCDELEAVHEARDEKRERLNLASLKAVTDARTPEDFKNASSFFINHLTEITVTRDHIKNLRQTILDLAVRGKLVKQNPKDEPASELLKRIENEKSILLKNGIIKKSEAVKPSCGKNIILELPNGWSPANLQMLCISISDGDHQPPPKAEEGVPFLVIGNVRTQTLDFDGCRRVTQEYYNSLDSIRRPQKHDILYTLVGSYGIPVMLVDDRPFCVQRHIGILRPSRQVDIGFLCRVLKSKFVFSQATACATGIAQKTVPLSGLRKIFIPLPPLPEQKRIVAKVDELMSLCDALESQISITSTQSTRLLNAVMQEEY